MSTTHLPPHSAWWFRQVRDRVSIGYIRKHAHALRLSLSSSALPSDDRPILVAMNHPSWWDPLIAYTLSAMLPSYTHYGVMEANALKKYAILRKAGIFGVESDSVRGAARFIKQATAILSEPRRALWVTAQGEFSDVRKRPLGLRSGVGHLAARLRNGWVVPIAIEVVYWNERTPELLARIGDAIPFPGVSTTTESMLETIEFRLTTTLNVLNDEAISRDASKFRSLVEGRSGIGGVYDWWRRLQANIRGQQFNAAHDTK